MKGVPPPNEQPSPAPPIQMNEVVFLDSTQHYTQPQREILEDEKMELSPRGEPVTMARNPLGVKEPAQNATEDVATQLVGVMGDRIELREQLAEWKQQVEAGEMSREQYKQLKMNAKHKYMQDREKKKRRRKPDLIMI